jgi:hypothetical protein
MTTNAPLIPTDWNPPAILLAVSGLKPLGYATSILRLIE